MMRRTLTRLYPVGAPFQKSGKPRVYGPGKKWSIVDVQPEGPAVKDPKDITERGWVCKVVYQLQPITFSDLWEEIFISPFNPIHSRAQLKNIIKHMRKDMQIYLRMDPDDLQFYIYLYPQWARLSRRFIDVEKKLLQEEDSRLALNPPPPYPADPLRYYHQYLTLQEEHALRRIEELKRSGEAAVEVV
eukprot:TRINITY_DN65866_c0_g1_i1.p1 TRINITY_DN65866_c0_g1~~TRINITY_DN65866_c0_g1_i1.p1  ORF type:complete len:188 (+),score=68.74 TRINITY_DN65866_c0_g1_i1:78-641(+)